MNHTQEAREARFAIDYSAMREFKCAAKKCKAVTADWFKEGWGVVGLNDFTWDGPPRQPFKETTFARLLLESKEVIEKTPLSCVLLCPAHTNLADDALALREDHAIEHHEPDFENCNLCTRESAYKRAEEANPLSPAPNPTTTGGGKE